MIEITKCKFADRTLYIDAKVKTYISASTKEDLLDEVGIKYVRLYPYDGYSSSGAYTEVYTNEDGEKSISLELHNSDLTSLGSLISLDTDKAFVVVVGTDDNPPSGIPCGMDLQEDMVLVFDMCDILNRILNYSKELDKSCEIPKELMDLLLQLAAVKYAVKGRYIQEAINMYTKYFTDVPAQFYHRSCGCHG